MEPYYADATVTIHHGDCLDVLRELPAASVDAVVTDPPYGLEFMGKAWDRLGDIGAVSHAGIPERDGSSVFGRAARVNYNGSSNVRCRNCDKWKWGHKEGDGGGGGKRCHCDRPDFPSPRPDQARLMQEWHHRWAAEALRVLKPGGHLLAFGGTRTYHRLACAVEDAGFEVRDSIAWLYGSGFPKSLDVSKAIDKAAGAEREPDDYTGLNAVYGNNMGGGITLAKGAPATPDAERWQGWGTALKPAFEPIVVARRPLAGTVAGNVLAWGTGALNVDGCRVYSVEVGKPRSDKRQSETDWRFRGGSSGSGASDPAGRWPANVVLDESQAAALDAQSGEQRDGVAVNRNRQAEDRTSWYGTRNSQTGEDVTYGGSGGASRFFYTAKADAAERVRVNGTAHPTVKPLALMRWLVRLVTPPGGTVLEPFAGSGTTVEACILEGFRCIAIEREADYLPLIRQRIHRRRDPVEAVRAAGDDGGLFDLIPP